MGRHALQILDHASPALDALRSLKQKRFVVAYVGPAQGNATEAAERAGYAGDRSTLAAIGAENLRKPHVAKAIEGLLQEQTLGYSDVLHKLSEHAGASMEPFLRFENDQGDPLPAPQFDLQRARAAGVMHLVKELKFDQYGNVESVKLHDAQKALTTLARLYAAAEAGADASAADRVADVLGRMGMNVNLVQLNQHIDVYQDGSQ